MTVKKPARIQLVAEVPAEMKEFLNNQAKLRETNISSILRQIIRQEMNRNKGE